MSAGWWIDNCAPGEPKPHVIVDFGYATEENLKRAEAVATLVGPRNRLLMGFNRMGLRIPPRKLKSVLAAFPQIEAKSTYFGATHSWLVEGPTNGD